ncbi:MAG: maltose ABC transporter substrate-binding protein, partial [Turicibacter sp.]
MKKLLALMFVAGLSVSGLVACGGNDSSSEKPTTEKPSSEKSDESLEKVEIKLWLDDDNYAEAIIPAIEEALPNIKISYEKVGSTDARQKLELDGPAGLGGDIFIQPHDGMG